MVQAEKSHVVSAALVLVGPNHIDSPLYELLTIWLGIYSALFFFSGHVVMNQVCLQPNIWVVSNGKVNQPLSSEEEDRRNM